MPARKSYICGVGCTAFEKPRNRRDYPEIAVEAATKALLDAGITYDAVEQAYAGELSRGQGTYCLTCTDSHDVK